MKVSRRSHCAGVPSIPYSVVAKRVWGTLMSTRRYLVLTQGRTGGWDLGLRVDDFSGRLCRKEKHEQVVHFFDITNLNCF